MEQATVRRLKEELGLETNLSFLYKFRYLAYFGVLGAERELCSVYGGVCDDRPEVNDKEISDWRYINSDDLEQELKAEPDNFTPWFKMEWQEVMEHYKDGLIKSYRQNVLV